MPSNEEVLKGKIEELGKTVHDFKQANDERLKEIEKGAKDKNADPLLEGKVDKANEHITKLEDQMKSLETAINRKAVAPAVDNKLIEKYQQYQGVNSQLFKDGKFNQELDHEYKKNFIKFLKRGETKDLSVGSDPDGGFLVRPEVGELMKTFEFETSPFRQWMGQIQISSDAIEFPTDGDELAFNWVGETASRPATTTNQFGMRRIPIHELTASPQATQKLLDDSSVNIEQMLSQKASERFARAEANAFAVGNGVAKPRGFLTYDDGTTGDGDIEQVITGNATSLTSDGLIDVEAALKALYRTNANWFMARATISAARKLKDLDGQYLWQPGLQQGNPPVLLGYPVVEATDMPAVASDNLAAALGDFRMGYKIVDRIGIRVLRDPFTNKPFIVFDYTKRVGGDVVVFEAIKIQKISA